MKPESALQAAAWVYAQQVLPPEADFASVETKIGSDNRMAGMFRKMVGVRAGQPDCQIVFKGRVAFVELKVSAAISDAQHKRHAELRRAGAEVYVVRSIATLRQVFMGMNIPLRHHALTAEMRDEMLAARRAAPRKATGPRRTPRPSRRALAFAMEAQKP
jgi:hypothetical protein